LKAVLSIRITFCALWMLAAGVGMAVFWNHESVPIKADATPEYWPQNSQIDLDSKRATLVMFTHPKCHCTRASMAELNKLMSRFPGRVAAHVVSIQTREVSDSQTQVEKDTSMKSPDMSLYNDTEDGEAHLFGAKNSGFVAFYGPDGRLLFKGGITSARGNKGDNPGASAIVALLNGRNPPSTQAPVYGCSLGKQSQGLLQTTALLTR
jgi:hypothetical protein